MKRRELLIMGAAVGVGTCLWPLFAKGEETVNIKLVDTKPEDRVVAECLPDTEKLREIETFNGSYWVNYETGELYVYDGRWVPACYDPDNHLIYRKETGVFEKVTP